MSGKYNNVAKYALIIAVIPVVILLLIFLGNTIYELSGGTIYFNVLDIYNKELFAFAGNYLGGVTTLVAMYFIVRHFKNESQHQTYVAQLDKEKECIFDAVARVNPLTASSLYNQYNALPSDVDDYKRVQVLEIKRDINFQREQLMLARTELQLKTDILDEYDKCNNCPKKCSMIKYSEKFGKQYLEAENIIYNFLLNLEQFIDVNSQNNEYAAVVSQLNKQMEAPRLTSAAKDELAEQIEKNRAYIRDAEVLISDLALNMTSISQIHLELKTKLIHTAKGYYSSKLRDEYKSYMRIKSNDVRCKQANR